MPVRADVRENAPERGGGEREKEREGGREREEKGVICSGNISRLAKAFMHRIESDATKHKIVHLINELGNHLSRTMRSVLRECTRRTN